LQDAGALETIAHYLALLEEAFLVASVAKYSPRPARRRAAPPKLVTLSNAFLAVIDPRGIPDRGREPARFGAWVENACLAHAWNVGQQVSYWREEPPEVDAVLEGSWGKWAIEVKTSTIGRASLLGLAEFVTLNRDYHPLVLCDQPEAIAVERLGIEAMPWHGFLLGWASAGLTVRKVGDGNCSKKSSTETISEDALIGPSSADFTWAISAESAA
jgi:predicted AAA+ superfamily ATPase